MNLKISKFLNANKSFFIMALSSSLYFSATFLAKKTMSENDFYYWNVLLTISAISYSFCFFGSEQLFLRCGELKGGRYHIPNNILKIMFFCFLLYFGIFSVLTNMVLFRVDDYLLTTLVALLSANSVFVYNLLRITKLFTASQLINNFWKIALFFAVLVAGGSNVKELLYITLLLCTLISGVVLIRVIPKLKVTHDATSNIQSLFLSFALSLLVLVLLNNFDRFFIEKLFMKEQFSSYVYLLSLLIMPFSIISSYIGFKEVSALKTRYVQTEFNKKVLFVALGLSVFFSVWFIILLMLSDYLELAMELSYFVPCLTIVVVKSVYSLYSSIFGLKGSAKQIQISNLVTIVAVAISVAFTYFFINEQPSLILYTVAAVWLSRVFVFAFFVRHQPDYQLA
ncbi:hypothetical protein [Pseudoalteromonas prydzensis]|uniref:hypothetical protein n=1 Tax=Pseudoalteromonas prydzensis TaxID=182141 RepID=UPI003FD38659